MPGSPVGLHGAEPTRRGSPELCVSLCVYCGVLHDGVGGAQPRDVSLLVLGLMWGTQMSPFPHSTACQWLKDACGWQLMWQRGRGMLVHAQQPNRGGLGVQLSLAVSSSLVSPQGTGVPQTCWPWLLQAACMLLHQRANMFYS